MQLDSFGGRALEFPPVPEVLGAVPASELDPLVSPLVRGRIADLARSFPVAAQTVCYECRLSEQDQRVDLALCLFPSRVPATQGTIRRPGPLLGPVDPWERCLRFLRDWRAPGSPLSPRFPFVWVAFDLEPSAPALPVPCLGLCVDRDFFAKRLGASGQPATASGELETQADECFQRFFHQPLPARLRTLFRRCLDAPGVGPRHFSFMLGRSPATFKLDLKLPLGGVASLLRRIDWPGPREALEAGIRDLMPWDGEVQLNLVLHPELVPPLEAELLTVPAEVDATRRNAVLDKLVGANLCSVAKAGVLRKIAEAPLLRSAGRRIGRSWYVKVRFLGETAVEAKAYVGLMPQLWPESGSHREVHRPLFLE